MPEQEPNRSRVSRCGVAVGCVEPISTAGDSQDPRADAALGCPWLGGAGMLLPARTSHTEGAKPALGNCPSGSTGATDAHSIGWCPIHALGWMPDPRPEPAPKPPRLQPAPPGWSGPPSPALLHPPQQRWGWEGGWWREPAPRLEGSTARNSTCASAARPGHVPAPHPPQPGHFVTSDVSDGPSENHQTRSVSYPTSSKRV